MKRGIPYLDDSNMEELPNEIIEKLRNMIDVCRPRIYGGKIITKIQSRVWLLWLCPAFGFTYR